MVLWSGVQIVLGCYGVFVYGQKGFSCIICIWSVFEFVIHTLCVVLACSCHESQSAGLGQGAHAREHDAVLRLLLPPVPRLR